MLPGFAYADVACAGFSIVVTTIGDPFDAYNLISPLASEVLKFVDKGNPLEPPIKEVMSFARQYSGGPIGLIEPSDNIGGGTPGDGTGVLQSFIKHEIDNAAVVINDPDAVSKCFDVSIGDGCKIQNNVSVYDAVTLEDDVFCGPSMVFTNVHNPRSKVVRKDEYRPTLVKQGATLGANCTIVCGNTIGEYAFIGAGALVSFSVKAYALVMGVPAKQVGWMSAFGIRLDLPLTGDGFAQCSQTKLKYELKNGEVRPCE